MNIERKRELLLQNIQRGMRKHGITLQPHEIDMLEDQTVYSRRFGDLLTLSILTMKIPFRWYDSPETANQKLPLHLFISVFSEALSQERNIRRQQKGHEETNAAIIEGMQHFVDNTKTMEDTATLKTHMNSIWMTRSRTKRIISKNNWTTRTHHRVLGYLSSATAAMPSIKAQILLNDLLYQHGSELQQLTGADSQFNSEFQQTTLSLLKHVDKQGGIRRHQIQRQTNLF